MTHRARETSIYVCPLWRCPWDWASALLCRRVVSLFFASVFCRWFSSKWCCSRSRPSRCRRPKKSCAGELPSWRLVFRQAAKACCMFSPFSVQRKTMLLRFFTAASASPLLSGLYGEESSCCIPCAAQNSLNSDLNCGLPSVLMCVGQPKSLNQFSRCCITAFVSSLRNAVVHA